MLIQIALQVIVFSVILLKTPLEYTVIYLLALFYTSLIITKDCYDKAKELNLTIKVSKNPLKKIDAYEDNILIAKNLIHLLDHSSYN